MAPATPGEPEESAPKSARRRNYRSRQDVIWEELKRLGRVPSEPLAPQHIENARNTLHTAEEELRKFGPEDPAKVARTEKRVERLRVLAQLLQAEYAFRQAPGSWSKWRLRRKRDGCLRLAGQVFALPRPLQRQDVILEELQAGGRLPRSPVSAEAIQEMLQAREKAREQYDTDSRRATQFQADHPNDEPGIKERQSIAEASRRERDAAELALALISAQRNLEAAEDPEAEQAARQERNLVLPRVLHSFNLGALCLSGGGIRSASFSLGILQGLARCSYDPPTGRVGGVLGRFNYLSTVSGGGYIGSWLTRWSSPSAGNLQGNFHNSVQQLAAGACPPEGPEPCAVRNLRDYTSYLAPKRGLSGDFLALVATYLRNLLLNWSILLPCLLAVALLPAINSGLMRWLSSAVGSESWFLIFAGFAVSLGLYLIAEALPERPPAGDGNLPARQPRTSALAQSHTWVLLMGAYLLACWALVGLAHSDLPHHSSTKELAARVHLLAAPAPTYKYVDWVKSERVALSLLTLFGMLAFGALRYRRLNVRRRAPAYWLAYVLSAAVGAWLYNLIFLHVFPRLGADRLYVTFAVPLILTVFLLTGTALTGLLSSFESDEDREWIARSGGMLMRCSAIWMALHALVLWERPELRAASGVLAAILGPALSWAGYSPKTASGKTSVSMDQLGKLGRFLAKRKLLLPLGACVFLLLLVVCAAAANQFLVGKMHNWTAFPPWQCRLILFSLYLGIAIFASLYVDVNTFSMHGLYRNRLMRAYLGASNGDRRPDPYTNFDPRDNMDMAGAAVSPQAPLHLVNATLNLVATRNLAWQERKAEPFSISPLHCGSFRLGYRRTPFYAGDDGPALATAMAISGAAATPNMGYHSSPLVTFLMALFNVRLGWWWPNPGSAGDAVFREAKPSDSLSALLCEATGKTNDEDPWVYLSDGGHFENLGLYEMVMRRCHTIVVVDGSADPQFTMEDLGNAFRKIQIDFGIPIELQAGGNIQPGMAGTNRHAALYHIRYACVDGDDVPDGVLVYLKASLCARLSEDVKHYASAHPSFPHEPTSDQFFGESQFESYRRLGAHVIEHILNADRPGWFPPHLLSLDAFIERAQTHAGG